MLVVKIELHSAVTGRVTEIGRTVIFNDGMSRNVNKGNYVADVIRKPPKGRTWDEQTDLTMQDEVRSTRRSRVDNYSRLSRPVWDLVTLALKNMGYGK